MRSAGRLVVLRRHRLRQPSAVAFEHLVIDHARAHGIPCPRIVPSLNEDRIVARRGRLHTLYCWEPGSHAPRGHAGRPRAHAAGVMLASIHDALRTIPDGPRDGDGLGDLAATYSRMTQLEDALRSTPRAGREWILADPDARRRWLAANQNCPDTCVGNPQVIHGDFQLTNVLFEGESISAVVDWDKARVAWPLMEVVRSLDHGLGLAKGVI